MKNWLSLAALLALTIILTPAAAQEGGFVKLFNGKNLDGWKRTGMGKAEYRVEDGCIVGKTVKGSPNTFLRSEKEYGDFELKFEVKVDNALNSGVQIRSKNKGGSPKGRVHGPQVEIAVNGTAGYIYGEALGTGWLSRAPGKNNPAPHKFFKNGKWNKYRVKAVGNHIQTWVNGHPVADLKDTKSNMPRGFLGLQVHAIGRNAGPYEVRWREIYLKDLTK